MKYTFSPEALWPTPEEAVKHLQENMFVARVRDKIRSNLVACGRDILVQKKTHGPIKMCSKTFGSVRDMVRQPPGTTGGFFNVPGEDGMILGHVVVQIDESIPFPCVESTDTEGK